MSIKSIVLSLFIFFESIFAFGQKSSSAKKELTARFPNKLAAVIDSTFSLFNEKNSPGVAVTIIENGKVIFKKAYGLASIEHNVKFNHNSTVRLPYSEGREFIAIAAVLMEFDGIISLNDKVRKFFPELPDWAEPVTIGHLIQHRSGFADEWDALLLMMASMSNRFDVSQFLNLLYRQPKPEVEPGKGYMYSNSDYGLLRLILEKASDQNLSSWMEKRIFAPLGMKSTLLHDDPTMPIRGYANKYTNTSNNIHLVTGDKTSPGGNYYIATTANDLEKWASVNADPNSEIFKAINLLLHNGQTMPGRGDHYVFGVKKKIEAGNKLIIHEGVNNYTYLTEIPDRKIQIITLGNYFVEYEQYHKKIWQSLINIPEESQFIKREFNPAAVSYSSGELQNFAGKYYDSDTVSFESYVPARKKSFKFIVIRDTLNAVDGAFQLPLLPYAKNIFKSPLADVYAVFKNESLEIHETPTNKVYHFIKDNSVVWNPSKEELEKFTGKYYSKHLDYYWTLELNEKGNIVIRRPTIADTEVEPETKDQFILKIQTYEFASPDDARILFHKDVKGLITHFTVWHPRLMHHRFDKVKCE